MPEKTREETLGAALTALKRRSGRSFESLARRLSVSKSALHRYAAGDAVPPRWDIVEGWARACGAEPGELAELERLWHQPTGAEPVTTAVRTPAPPAPARRRRWVGALGAVILLGTGGGATYAAAGTGERTRPGPCEKRDGVRHVDSRLAGYVWNVDFVCDNREGLKLFAEPGDSRAVAVMETPRSWFLCWTTEPGTAEVWYYTRGDRSEPGTEQEWDGWGFAASGDVSTAVHPPAAMPRCTFTG